MPAPKECDCTDTVLCDYHQGVQDGKDLQELEAAKAGGNPVVWGPSGRRVSQKARPV